MKAFAKSVGLTCRIEFQLFPLLFINIHVLLIKASGIHLKLHVNVVQVEVSNGGELHHFLLLLVPGY